MPPFLKKPQTFYSDLPHPEESSETPDVVQEPEETVEIFAETYPVEEVLPVPPKRSIRPELVMGIIAAFAAVLLSVMILLCLPFFGSDEDPEALPQRHENIRATEEHIPEQTAEETEPAETTIPPDPNPYDRYDFQYNRHNYLLLQNVESSPGVDVSAYQGNIDWEKVAGSGIEFAIVRLGYRGYESGKLVADDYAVQNLEGARAAGLKVGAYFFSRRSTPEKWIRRSPL